MDEFIKMIIKVVDESTGRVEWVHFAYVNESLYHQYLEQSQLQAIDMNDVLARWVKEDFNVTLSMSCRKDVEILKSIVKDFYKRANPEIYMDSPTDRQGWVRVWVTKKMKEDLNIYGEQCI